MKRTLTLKIEVEIYDLEAESPHCTVAQLPRTDGTFFTGYNRDKVGFKVDEMKRVADIIIEDMENYLKLEKGTVKAEY